MSTLIDAHPSFCTLRLFLLLTFLLLSYYNIMIIVQVSAQVGAFSALSQTRPGGILVVMTVNCEGPYNQLVDFHNDRFWQAAAVRSSN
jgi:hypothetical protein